MNFFISPSQFRSASASNCLSLSLNPNELPADGAVLSQQRALAYREYWPESQNRIKYSQLVECKYLCEKNVAASPLRFAFSIRVPLEWSVLGIRCTVAGLQKTRQPRRSSSPHLDQIVHCHYIVFLFCLMFFTFIA